MLCPFGCLFSSLWLTEWLTQAGEPVAFFVGKNADTVDSFVATLLHAGFGTGGEAAEISVLSRVLQVRLLRELAHHVAPYPSMSNAAYIAF